MLLALHATDNLADLRRKFVDSFTSSMASAGLDRFEAAGMVAEWWQQSSNELKTAASRGWKAAIEAWLTTAEASQEENKDKTKGKKAPDLAEYTAIKLLAGSQLEHRADLVAEHARLAVEIKRTEASEDDDEADDELNDVVSPAELKKLKAERTKVKKALKAVDDALLAEAHQTLQAMHSDDAPIQALGVLCNRIEQLVTEHFATIESDALAWYQNLVSKYSVTLSKFEAARNNATTQLAKHLQELGYE